MKILVDRVWYYIEVLLFLTTILTTEDEQIEIVRIIGVLMDKEDCVKCLAEDVIDKIEIMKKSILAKAFRGKLGTNNPNEESAIELLKSILEE